MGRIGVKAIVYFEVVTTIALFIGLGRREPGASPARAFSSRTKRPKPAFAAAHHDFSQISSNTSSPPASSMPWRAATCCKLWSSHLYSARPARPSEPKRAPVVEFCESLAEVMFRYTKYVMYLAPFGVGAPSRHHRRKGLGVLVNLGKLVVTLYVAQALVVVLVFGARRSDRPHSLRPLHRDVREPFLIAFSTASSEAALPLALENMERSAFPSTSSRSCCPPATASIWSAPRCIFRWPSVFIAQAAGSADAVFSQQCDDADADADQQRRGRRAARRAGDPGRNSPTFNLPQPASRCCSASTR